jgi:hypothetical protein
MVQESVQRKVVGRARQRLLASALLLLFVTDIGFHVAEALWSDPPSAGTSEIAWQAGHSIPVPHSDCGIPSHSGLPFHHHHFPAVISLSSFTLVFTALAWVAGTSSPRILSHSLVTAQSRAPPL